MPSLYQWVKKHWVWLSLTWGWHLLWESGTGNLLQKRKKDKVYFPFWCLLSLNSSFNSLLSCPPNLLFLFCPDPVIGLNSIYLGTQARKCPPHWHLDPLTHHIECTPWLQTLALLVPSEITWASHVTFFSLRFLICKMGVYGSEIHIAGYREGQIE